MRIRSIKGVLAALVLWGSMTGVQAAEISISPLHQEVMLGNQIMLLLYADFRDEAALGGGLDIFFDSAGMAFAEFNFMAAESVGDDPDFRRMPDVLDGELNGLAFGNFEGMHGRSLIGMLTLDTLAVGDYQLTMAANEGGPPDQPGPFVSFVTGMEMSINFTGASISIIAQAVPVPAAIWLMLGGLGLLGGLARRKNS